MKKRLSLALLTCLLLNISVSAASAASIESQLADLAVKSAQVNGKVQEYMQIKEVLETGKKNGMLGTIAAAALIKVQKDNGLPITSGDTVADTVKQAAQQVIQQKVQGEIAEKVAPYQNIVDTLGLLKQLQGKLSPQSSKQNDTLTGAPQNYSKILDMTATAYAPGPADNGIWGDKTYIGTKVRKGVVAVDPRVIPMGTKLWVEGYGYAVAEDQGSAIKGNRIDLAYNDYQTATNYGIQNVKVYVLK
jgi:3D (Asp-Asp-Asp) domain-containing protein